MAKKKAARTKARRKKGSLLANETAHGVVAVDSLERGCPAELTMEGEVLPVLPCPIATDPAMGDKTPAVMAWYLEHRPEEYARRYGNRIRPGAGADTMVSTVGERGPVSDFEEEDEVVVKPRVIMG